jgi:tetratricopeptide (TPR) repeat protein
VTFAHFYQEAVIMRLDKFVRCLLVLSIGAGAASLAACNKTGAEQTASASEGGKVPITTRSGDARQEFLKGQDLADRLLGAESLQHFDKALSIDPEFASAELARANSSPTAKEFSEHQKKAVELADKVSEGERLLILANQAGANGDAAKQKEYLEKLVAAYPNDERAQFALANFYFGQQDLDPAIEHYKKSIAIAPKFSGPYNVLGYAYRQKEDYSDAEDTFKKYTELIPNDPNPYDSYAELLLKMGRFEDSITQYRKALSIEPHFVPSHFGLAAALLYAGKADEAQAELQTMADQARNDGELRTAYFGMAVVASDAGKFDLALKQMDKEFAVAQKKNDIVAMAADLQASGNIQEQMRKYDEARRTFDHAFQMIQTSSQPQEIKDNSKLLHEYNLASIAIWKKDYAAAKSHAAEFQKGVDANKNAAIQVEQSHELQGRIALATQDYDKAISELQQANQQDALNLYRLSQAYAGKGDSAKASELRGKAAGFNSLPALNYAFVRVETHKG